MSPIQPDARLRKELRSALAEWGADLSPDDSDDVPLISSGALDSLGLYQLSLWIEQKLGHPVDPTQLDLETEWNTVAGILGFIETTRRKRAR